MHFLYCDETNLDERAGDFLIYGGLSIPAAEVLPLSHAVDAIRLEYGMERSFRLKFNPGPAGLPHERFIEAKQRLLELLSEHRAQMICYAILHDIATSADEARRNGINTVCYHFDGALARDRAAGLVLIDRFNDRGNQIDTHLAEKFAVGVTGLPHARELRLRNIVGFHYSSIGQGHLPSLVDIALGSLRFAMNALTRQNEQHRQTAFRLLTLLSPLLQKDQEGRVVERSFLFSPKVVRAERYRVQYQAMKDFFGEAGVRLAQPITDQPAY